MNDNLRFPPDAKEPVALEAGDICIAASYAVGEVDIRRNVGEGRVLVYDRDLKAKGALWTGETGLVLGLAYCPDSHSLFASDVASQTVTRFAADGTVQAPFPQMQGKPFGPIALGGDGTIVIGEHIRGDKMPFIGGGEIYCFDGGGALLGHYGADYDPGKFGFHGVTNMALADDGKRAIYISETGKRVMQYDLAQGCQLDDLFTLPEDGDKATAGISLTPSGQIIMATVYGADLYAPDGELLKEYDIPNERGWAAVRACADGQAFFVANFFTGRLEKRSLETGDIIASADTGLIYKLASIVEIS